MNLVGTLAKAAIGMMVARGVGKMMRGGSSGGSAKPSGGGLGGLGDLLGGLAGGKAKTQSRGQDSGGMGGLLDELTKTSRDMTGGQTQAPNMQSRQPGGGGLGDLLGGALSGGGSPGGGLGGLLESLGGGGSSSSGGSGGFGEIFNKSIARQPAPEPEPDQNEAAKIMLRGMINAAKSDGEIDAREQEEIVESLGEVTQEEVDFVRAEMAKPLNVDAFIDSVPNGLEQQVYLMSLLGIELDSQAEAQYLDRLARGMGVTPEQANEIHAKVGVPNLYS